MSTGSNSNLSEFTKIIDETDIKTWIKTDAVTDSFVKNGFRVTWIEWDSDFRNSDLQIEDIIIGYDDVSFEQFLEPGKHGSAIGQYGETMYWQKLGGVKHGHIITLKVFREGTKETFEIPGKLLAQRFYTDSTEDRKRALGPGGPAKVDRDGFSGSWSGWYKDFVKKMSSILDGGWDHKSINNKKELKEHEGQKERIDFLQKKYPGPFADVVLSDWQKVHKNLLGKEIDEVDLEYREIGAKRVETVKQEAQIAWDKMRTELKDDMITAFPAVDVDKRKTVAGKIIELPWITTRNIINDLSKTLAVIGNRTEGYYFIELSKSVSARKFYDAMYRYSAQVSPKLQERYQYLAKITDIPALVTLDRKAVTGLTAKIIAARAGSDGEIFVDLQNAETTDDEIKFAGQEKVSQFAPIKPKDDASPAQVIETMIDAVKIGHEKAWQSLFATWRAYLYWENHITFDPSYIPKGSFPGAWKQSRKLITDRVYDVRVDKTNTIRRIIHKDEDVGFPDIDEVDVFVDHYELDENGKYRTFLDVNVRRKWTLQRLDEGPWRIITVQVI